MKNKVTGIALALMLVLLAFVAPCTEAFAKEMEVIDNGFLTAAIYDTTHLQFDYIDGNGKMHLLGSSAMCKYVLDNSEGNIGFDFTETAGCDWENAKVNPASITIKLKMLNGETTELSGKDAANPNGNKGTLPVGSFIVTDDFAIINDGDDVTLCIDEYQPEAKAIHVEPEKVTLTVGQTQQLDVAIEPENADKSVTFKSTDEIVATVSAEGLITAVAPGEATITVSTGNELSNVCKVTVAQPPVESVKLNPEKAELKVAETQQLTFTVEPADAIQQVTFKSSDENVATVSADGLITAVTPGEATITVTAKNDKTAACNVVVTDNHKEPPADTKPVVEPEKDQPSVEAVKLNPEKADLKVAETKQLEFTVEPADADQTVTFASDDEKVATVSAEGLITAVAPGTCKITAAAGNDKTATCAVTVTETEKVQPTVKSVKINPDTMVLTVSETQKLAFKVEPADADQALTFKSGNEKVATVSADGTVKAVAPGKTKITVTAANGTSVTCTVTVIDYANPETGDNAALTVFVVLAAVSMLALAIVPKKRKA